MPGLMNGAPASRVVLVTGCSSGIGRATAIHLAAEGWTVVATARRPAAIADLEAHRCRVMPLDVTSETSMREAVEAIEASHGAVGVLVNNAGYSQSGAVETVPMARVREQFETNVFGPARLAQLVLPGMRRQRWGRIVNLSSMGGRLVLPGGGYYHATKYAVEALSDALRFEVQGFGIDVIVIEPGLIRSGFGETAVSTMTDPSAADDPYGLFHEAVARATRESYYKGSLARLTGSPEDVARVIARALAAPRPRTRYTVSASARVLLGLRRVLSDRLWDRFLSSTYPIPR
jgi:NAD(P)-dependent dehydrogenase (short-subunit alcohol dehydrogenase family)